MRTEEQFSALEPAFYKAINGKSGIDFVDAVNEFIINTFEAPTMCLLYQTGEEQLIFITDHPSNDIGFVFHERFGKKSCLFVDSKKQVKANIIKYLLVFKIINNDI